MKLKEVSVQGFKSFSNKFNFILDDNLIGIIGPNGSGKSNIIDAIRWALGEQSAKNLRGSSMQDIIFSGTEEKKAKNFAEVSLTFYSEENDINQIVTRRLYKNGDSEYLLNGKKSKLKDISDIYLDLGINKESYSIITQGKVENIISSKPQDRRVIIEEAAGVLKYKNKRKETHLKLEKTKENLTRLNDIFIEIENRNNILEEQKDKAETFIKIRDELKEKDILIKVYDIKYLSTVLEEYNLEKDNIIYSKNILTNKYEEISRELYNLKSEIKEIDIKYNELKNIELEKVKRKERLQYDITLFEEKSKNEESLKARLNSDKDKLVSKKNNLQYKIEELKLELNNNKKEQALIEKKIEDLENNNSFSLEEVEKKIDDLKDNYFSLITKESKIQNELDLLNKIKVNANNDFDNINNELLLKNRELNEKRELLDNNKKFALENEEHLNVLLDDILRLKKEKELNNNKRAEILENISKGTNLLSNFSNKKDFLESQINSLNHYNIGVKEILSNKNKIEGIHSTLGDIIKVDKKYVLALDTALSSSQQNIIVDTAEVARICVDILKNNNKGRATFLPIDSIKSKKIDINTLEILKKCKGFIGIASDLVDFNKEYTNIVSNVLGLTLIVDNLYNGNIIAKKISFKYRIVTLDGQVINSGGSITGGSIYKNNNSIIKSKLELDELDDSIVKIENKLQKLKNELSKVDSDIILASKDLDLKIDEQYKIEINIKEYNLEINSLENTINILSESIEREEAKLLSINNEHSSEKEKNILKELDSIRKDLEITNKEIKLLNEKKINIKNDDNLFREQLSQEKINKYRLLDSNKAINYKISELDIEIQNIDLELSEIENNYNLLLKQSNEKLSIDEINKEIDYLVIDLEDIERKLKELISTKNNFYDKEIEYSNTLQNINVDISAINSKIEKINLNFAKKEVQLDDNINYLIEKYNTTYEREVHKLNDISIEELSNFKNIVSKLDKKLNSLGNVNLNAIDEYKEINERYLFYKEEIDDLVSSREKLYNTIKEIDKEVTDRFLNTFNQISANFDKIYKNLFNGGYAKISLDDNKDVLNCGINIEVSPPGKKLQKISLLSGGEKALTAMSLLFAILEIKNPPFVILDEVEAALDEDNVYKFSKFLKKYSIENQFIVVTHRRGTMEVMDKIYGITMKEKGVSYILPLEFKNILEENYLNE